MMPSTGIAKALAKPISYTTKYFDCDLGVQLKFDGKTGTSLVNGAHDTTKLASLLEIFIKKYVQCYGCGNTEIEILITKTQSKNGAKDKKAMRRAEKEHPKEGEVMDEELKKLKKETKKKVSSKEASARPTSKKKVNCSDEDHVFGVKNILEKKIAKLECSNNPLKENITDLE